MFGAEQLDAVARIGAKSAIKVDAVRGRTTTILNRQILDGPLQIFGNPSKWYSWNALPACAQREGNVLGGRVTNIFVGNLSYQTSEAELEAAFGAYGAVERASVVRDRDSGQPRGFAFVEMTNHEEAMKAIQALNGQELNGRQINVNEARPKAERTGGGGYGNRGGGGGAGGGGGRRREPRW